MGYVTKTKGTYRPEIIGAVDSDTTVERLKLNSPACLCHTRKDDFCMEKEYVVYCDDAEVDRASTLAEAKKIIRRDRAFMKKEGLKNPDDYFTWTIEIEE